MYLFPHYQLAVFTKAPRLGKAKTRMQPHLSTAFSLTLHTRLVDYVLTAWSQDKVCPLQLYLAGELNDFSNVLPQWKDIPVREQEGLDLGERLFNAASDILHNKKNILKENSKKINSVKIDTLTAGVILVGTDCPFIDRPYLSQACEALSQYDIVIGPASDGGYVLIGFKVLYAEIFKNIHWGSESVLKETLERIKALDLSYFLLPELDDIDHPSDLTKLKSISQFTHLLETYLN